MAREMKKRCISFDSYIKPQLTTFIYSFRFGCISFDSYIKPQLCLLKVLFWVVVYLLIPTSNHNAFLFIFAACLVVYLLIPTSNHNL